MLRMGRPQSSYCARLCEPSHCLHSHGCTSCRKQHWCEEEIRLPFPGGTAHGSSLVEGLAIFAAALGYLPQSQCSVPYVPRRHWSKSYELVKFPKVKPLQENESEITQKPYNSNYVSVVTLALNSAWFSASSNHFQVGNNGEELVQPAEEPIASRTRWSFDASIRLSSPILVLLLFRPERAKN